MPRPADAGAATASITPRDDGVVVSGALTFDSVPPVAARPARWLKPGVETGVDLSGVIRADSAGLALVLDWVAQARAVGGTLRFHDAPSQLLAIARASGLASLFERADGQHD